MVTKRIKFLKRIVLTILTLSIFQISKSQTVLGAGDMAIIGLNYDVTPHEISLVTFVPISAGTTIRITDYAYDSGTGLFAATSLTNTNEGSVAWTTTSAIAANTVFKMTITVSPAPAISGLPGTIAITGWTNPTPGTCPSSAGGDNWFIFQGSSATSVSNWVFGWTNPFAVTHNSIPQVIGQFLVAGSGMPNIGNTYLPPGLTLGLNAIALNYDPGSGGYHGDNNVYTGIKCGTQTTVLNAICNTANWLTSETTTYNIDPGGTYFPGVNPIFCVTAPCSTPTLNLTGSSPVLCNGGSTGSATVSASGGAPFTYTWSPSGGNAATATGLSAGVYTCVVTNSCGLTAPRTVTITQPTAVAASTAITNPLCNGANGSATITLSGGTSPYTYTWSSGPTSSVEPTLLAGTYTVRGTDANGCSITRSVTITQPSAIVTSTNLTNVACFGNSTGSATVTASGGTGGYTYLWSTGATTSVITGQNAGVKTVTVTDANSCTRVTSVTITQPASAVNTSTAITNVLCFGNSTGAATVTASGGTAGYTYMWSTGATTSVITGQVSGVRTVTVSDANGCTRVATVTISQPASAISTSTVAVSVLCFGNSTGAATVTASGGTGGYTYLWSTGATTSVITGQNAGVKTVTVTDANGCTSIKSVNITQPASALTASQSQTNITCFNLSGFASVNTSGGAGSYTYSWTPAGGTSSVSSALTSGNFTCSITDANNCTNTQTFAITANTIAPSVSISGTFQVCMGQSAVLAANGANTYSWSTSATTSTILASPSVLTTYSVVGTNTTNGCFASATHTLIVNSIPTVSVNSGVICSGQTFTMTPSGASTYTIQGGNAVVSPTANASYTVVGTSTAGCVSANTATSNVTVNSVPTVSVNSGAICSGNSFTITPSGASTYTIQGGNTVVSPTANTNYTVTGSSAAGCISSNIATSNVTVNALPTITASTSSSLICTLPVQQSATLTGSGATTYTWNPGGSGTTIVISPSITTTYTVSGTDANGCQSSSIITQSVSLCTGFSELSTFQSELTIYPNPVSGVLNISVASGITATDIVIANALGQIVMNEKITIPNSEINTTNLPNGIYFVQIINNNKILVTKKLVKQ